MRSTIRRRYSLLASAAYVLLGLVITGRSVAAHVYPLIILGLVFVALGAVRIRDYLRWRQNPGGP